MRTAFLKIKRERIISPGVEFAITELRDIEDFILVIAETTDVNYFQGQILDKNSTVVLRSPELDFDSCMEKIYKMINSLGKLVSADVKNSKINLKPLLNEQSH